MSFNEKVPEPVKEQKDRVNNFYQKQLQASKLFKDILEDNAGICPKLYPLGYRTKKYIQLVGGYNL